MTDPKVFYNQEDYWEVPNESYNNAQQKMFPYYIIMRLPGMQRRRVYPDAAAYTFQKG